MKAAEESKKNAVPAEHTTTVLEGSEMGEVKIHENVIASLVRRAALSVEGVSRLAGNTLVDNIEAVDKKGRTLLHYAAAGHAIYSPTA